LHGYAHNFWSLAPARNPAARARGSMYPSPAVRPASKWQASKTDPLRIDARIALVGFPSVGKSTLLSKITKTKSAVASYAFTTLTAIPGVMEYGGAEIQILDLPGIIEGASEGKGRGRQVISAAKTSDLIMMVLDATKKAEQRSLLEKELEAVGIRLNRKPPNIYLKEKKAGGMKINFMSPPKNLDEKVNPSPSASEMT
jgi:small GTP-binding protein